ncbi:MAG: NTP/NDP exchange transporter [Gemmatimonadota bacterium]
MHRVRRLSPIDRFLRLFADVRSGEGATALLLAINLFLILAAYSFIKPVRDSLIITGGGAELKSYLSAGLVLLLLFVVPAYGALANRMPRRRLINVVTFFFAACLVVFFFIGQLPVSLLVQGVAFFLWTGIFNVMVVAQLWAFANDVYSNEEGERLFPIVAVGASLGAVAGSFSTGGVIDLAGVYPPMLVAGGILVASLWVTNYVDARERRRTEADLPNVLTSGAMPAASQEIPLAEVRKAITGEMRIDDVRKAITGEISLAEVRRALEKGEAPPEPEARRKATLEASLEEVELGGSRENPYRTVLRCRYLLLIGLLMLFLTWVNTNGGYILDKLVENTAAQAVSRGALMAGSEKEYIGSFLAGFYGGVNTLGLLIQLFLVSRVIKYLGMRASLLILPLIALGSNLLIASLPVLGYVRWAKTVENATDYSLQNTVRNVIFLPCTREQKYKAKQAIDTFFVRAGDVSSAGLVFVGTTYLALGTRHFAVVNVAIVALALVTAALIGREYRRLVEAGRAPCVGEDRRAA